MKPEEIAAIREALGAKPLRFSLDAEQWLRRCAALLAHVEELERENARLTRENQIASRAAEADIIAAQEDSHRLQECITRRDRAEIARDELLAEVERLRATIKTAHAALPKDWPQVGDSCTGCGAPLFCSHDHREGCWAERVFMALDQALYPDTPTPKRGIAAIIGQWPGDETDEEIEEGLAALEDPLRHIACGLAWDHGAALEEITRLRRALGDVCAAAEPTGPSRRCAEIAGAALAGSAP